MLLSSSSCFCLSFFLSFFRCRFVLRRCLHSSLLVFHPFHLPRPSLLVRRFVAAAFNVFERHFIRQLPQLCRALFPCKRNKPFVVSHSSRPLVSVLVGTLRRHDTLKTHLNLETVDHFVLVLTHISSRRIFSFCLHHTNPTVRPVHRPSADVTDVNFSFLLKWRRPVFFLFTF